LAHGSAARCNAARCAAARHVAPRHGTLHRGTARCNAAGRTATRRSGLPWVELRLCSEPDFLPGSCGVPSRVCGATPYVATRGHCGATAQLCVRRRRVRFGLVGARGPAAARCARARVCVPLCPVGVRACVWECEVCAPVWLRVRAMRERSRRGLRAGAAHAAPAASAGAGRAPVKCVLTHACTRAGMSVRATSTHRRPARTCRHAAQRARARAPRTRKALGRAWAALRPQSYVPCGRSRP
jgi:hypothetical protein